MEVSARTAPKAAGIDKVETEILEGEDLENLAEEMIKFGDETGKKNFDRDAKNVKNSDALLLLSIENPGITGLNCGACGYNKCEKFEEREEKGVLDDNDNQVNDEDSEFRGPNCVWRLLDLGIAIGSASKTAGMFNADNRIMYRAGVVARKMDLIKGNLVLGIPISSTGKNIYFDR